VGKSEPITIRPIRGGPSVRKNARLSLERDELVVTDRRGRIRTFFLPEARAGYRFVYGANWNTQANYALVDGSGRAALLLDLAAFENGSTEKLERVTGLPVEHAPGQPPVTSDTLLITNPPYIKFGMAAFYPGAVAFGLWSVTHWAPFIWIVYLALAVIIPLLVLAKMATPSKAELAEMARWSLRIDQQTIAEAEAWLAKHGDQVKPGPDEPPASESHAG